DDEFELLFVAIRDHSIGRTRGDITVLTCWDADRLDLGRVGSRPHPDYLCTDFAKEKATINWAYRRRLNGGRPKPSPPAPFPKREGGARHTPPRPSSLPMWLPLPS